MFKLGWYSEFIFKRTFINALSKHEHFILKYVIIVKTYRN